MPVYTFTYETKLKGSLDTVWDFFSHPKNLDKITPPDLAFRTIGEVPDRAYAGLILHHIVRPLFNIPMRWVTEITHCNAPQMFVDEQRSGPYAMWHHQHHFAAEGEYVRMRDIVTYRIGYGVFDCLINPLVVRPKIQSIFSYRDRIITDIFKDH